MKRDMTFLAASALTLGMLCLGTSSLAQSGDGVTIAPAPSNIAAYEPAHASAEVRVNGRPDHVYAFLQQGVMDGNSPTLPSNFTQFDLAPGHSAVISATYAMNIQRAVVRPMSAGIKPQWNGKTVTFKIDRPGHYDLEVNDALSNPANANAPLLIFADAPEHDPTAGPNVTVFPTGKVTDLDPGYRFQTQANHTYVIPAGAVVRGVLLTDTQANVTVRGHGILLYDHDVFAHYSTDHLQQLSPIITYGSANFHAQGVTVVTSTNQYTKSPASDISPWAVHITKSPHARLENVKIINQFLDGIEFDGEQDASITGSFVQAGDDTLGIKAACYGYKGGGAGANPSHITFANDETITTGPGQPMQITELNQPSPSGKPCSANTGVTSEVSDISYNHIDVIHSSLSTKIGITNSAGVMSIMDPYPVRVHGITYNDVVVEDMVRKNFITNFDLTPHPALWGANQGKGVIRDIHLTNIRFDYDAAAQGGNPLNINFPGANATSIVDNINFTNLVVNGTHITDSGATAGPAGTLYDGKIKVLKQKFPPQHVAFH